MSSKCNTVISKLIGRVKRHPGQSGQVDSGPAPRKRLLVEALEQRLLLSGGFVAAAAQVAPQSAGAYTSLVTQDQAAAAPSATDALLGLGPAIVDLQVLSSSASALPSASARNADLLEIDLARWLNAGDAASAPLAFDIRAVGINGAEITQTAPGDYTVAARNPDGSAGTPWGRLVLSERYDADGADFAGSGRLLFVPFLPDPGNPAVGVAAPFTGSFELSYTPQASSALADAHQFEYQASQRVAQFTVRDNSGEPDAEDRVGSGRDALTVLRLQQRLQALGYIGVAGQALVVDGKLGANTRFAIGQFNAKVDGLLAAVPADDIATAWINDPQAPLAGTVLSTPLPRRPGLQEQAAIAQAVTEAQRIFDQIAQGPDWAAAVPLLDGSLDDLLPLQTLAGALMQATIGTLADEPNLSQADLVRLLSSPKTISLNVAQSDGSTKAMDYTFGLKAGSTPAVTITDASIVISNLELVADRTDPVQLDLGADAATLGLKLTGSTAVNLKQSWSFKLGLEIRRDRSLPAAQAVVFHQLHLDGALDFQASGLNARLRVGSMEGSLLGGVINPYSLKVGTGLQGSALGSNGLSLVQLAATPLTSVTETAWDLRIQAQLPITLDNSTAKQTLYLDDGSAAHGALVRTGGAGTLAAVTLATLAPDLANLRFAPGGSASGNATTLAELGNTDTSQMLAMLDKLRDALNTLGTSVGHAGEGSPLQLAWPDIEVPLLGTLKWPELSSFLRLGDWIQLPDLAQATSTFDLPSWQDIAKQIPGFTLAGNAFDATTKLMTYAINLDQSLGQWTTRMALGDGDQSVPAPLTPDTAVGELNGGAGMADLGSGLASLRVDLRSGASFDVALAGVATLQEVIARIETASRSNAADPSTQRVRVRLGSQADRLVIEDNTSGAATFKTLALNGLKTAAAGSGLGLVGEDVDGDGSITGADLVGAGGSLVNASARIKGSFKVMMDLNPLGRGFTLSGKTLAKLNGGAGLVAGAANGADDIRISLRNGSVVGVNLSGLSTVQELVARLNGVAGLKAGVSLTELVAESSTSDDWNALDSATRAMKGETARLWLQDTTAPGPGSSQIFKVEAANGSLRGAAYIGLGLLGSDDDGERGLGDSVIAGATLHGDALENHLFISDKVQLTTSVELSVPDIDARLQVDGLAVGVQNGSAQLRAELPLLLNDPGLPAALLSTDAQGLSTFSLQAGSAGISLAELIGAMGDSENKVVYSPAETSTRLQHLVGKLVLKGSATLDLPVVTAPATLLAGTANPGISVNWTDLSNAATLRTETRGLNLLQGLRNFAFSDLLANLREVQHQIVQLEAQSAYQQALPLLGQSLAGVVSLSDQFGQFIDALALHPVDTVAQLQASIQQALAVLGAAGGATNSTANATTTYSQTANQSLIQLGLNFDTRGSTTAAVDLDLADLGAQAQIDGITGNLLASRRDVTLAWLGALSLSLDIDVSNPLAPVVFIRDDSRARFGLGLDEGRFTADSSGKLTLVDGLDANAALGPLGLLVRQGTVRLNDGNRILAVDPANLQQRQVRFDHLATWTADLRNETAAGSDGKYRLGSEFKADLLDTSTAGRIDVVLPIKFPTESTALDAATPSVELHVADLARLTSATALKALTTSTDADNRARVPNFGAAVAGLGAMNGDLSKVWDGIGESWTAAFDTLDGLLAQGAFNVPLPLIGTSLADSVGFVRDLRDALAPVLSSVVGGRTTDILRNKVLEALRPWIKDHNGNGVIDGDLNGNGARDTNEDFVVLANADRVEFDLEFYSNTQLAGADIGFDLGLPGLGLELDGSVQLDLGFSWKFGFGISRADGFYLKLPDDVKDDLRVDLTATLPGFAATGKLGFLTVKATDDADSPSQVQGSFIVDLKDPSRDQKLTVSDLRSGASIGQMFEARFSGEAVVNLDLESSFQGSTSFPRVAADLGVTWTFAEASTQGVSFGDTPPTVTFDHVRFNAGDFINGLLKPLITQVKSVIDPIQPALDFLTNPLPGISDLLGVPTTLLDVAQALGAPNIGKVRQFIDQVQYLSSLVDTLAATTASGWIEVGSMTVDTDIRKPLAPGVSLAHKEKPRSAADVSVSAQLGKSGGKSLVDNAESSKGGFDFPLLNTPASLFGILMGQNVTLVTYNTPALHARMPFSTPQFPVLSPIIYGSIFGAIGLDTQFSFGYDTAGVKRYGQTGDLLDLANGFYVDDLTGGRDVAELSVYGEIGLQASLNKSLAPIVQAGASGALRAQIDFNLNDPNNDGVVRLDEIVRNLNLGPIYVFDTSGSIDFAVKAWFWMGADLPFPIGKVTLAEGSIGTSIKILDFSVPRPDNSPRLATLESDGTLSLNMGSRAGLRANGNTSDGDETFRLTAGSTADSVLVEAFGFSKTYTGVKRIVGDAGQGNDTVQVGAGLALQSITLHGGSGNDTLSTAGTTAVRFYGDAGRDQLTGADGNDLLDGGDDNDLISGGAGDDKLTGGGGNDQMQGGLGSDTMDGGDGDDVIAGDAGNDQIFGGNGSDVITGGSGNDEIDGGSGDDSLDGGQGDDVVYGDAGNDQLRGGDGDDYLVGGDGDDVLRGERGNDFLIGDDGNDQLWGGIGNDFVAGNAGDDTLFGGEDRRGVVGGAVTLWGADTLVGGQGNDLVVAGSGVLAMDIAQGTQLYGDDRTDSATGGDDVIYGSNAADVIRAGSGNDTVTAYGGDDTIMAGAGNDTVDAGDGNDTVVGGSGSDVLDGGNGSDLIWGGQELVVLSLGQLVAGNPVNGPAVLELPPETSSAAQALAFGATAAIMPVGVNGQSQRDDGADAQDGADIIRGGAGRDWIFGGGGDDDIDAGAGQDYVDGGAGNDTLMGGDDADVLRGGDGDDDLHGNGGADLLLGEAGRDSLWGDETPAPTLGAGQAQRLYGGDGDDTLYAWSANPVAGSAADSAEAALLGDQLFGGAGRDTLYGGLRSDTLDGGAGADVLLGDAVAGNTLLTTDARRLRGGADLLLGGNGEDVLQGGGGDDVLYGGGDADRLEGQAGSDRLYGGGGSDALIVDLDPAYGAASTDWFDGHGDAGTPDNGVDRFLIVGTAGNDRLVAAERLGGQGQRLLVVQRRDAGTGALQAESAIDWRPAPAAGSSNSLARVEQFQFVGLAGDDRLEFAVQPELDSGALNSSVSTGLLAVDLAELSRRGSGWVAVMEGGSGDDTLYGSGARDYLDGGAGSDQVFGYAGDDQLWGDADGLGTSADRDQLFGGLGNDDLYAGPGATELFAWSINPYATDPLGRYWAADGSGLLAPDADPALRIWLGVSTDVTGFPVQGNGDQNNDGWLDILPSLPALPFVPEATGLNRAIGGDGADRLYGGTGLDALIGKGGANVYLNRDGQSIQNVGDVVFNLDPDHPVVGSSSAGFWAYGGSNVRDQIRVDFVTEPGLLTGHHLITRLTENAGNFSFDASVRLDLGNWTTDTLFKAAALINGDDVDGAGAALANGVEQSRDAQIQGLLASLLNGEEKLNAIYIDAMGGDDDITVGPTVQTSIWVNAGDGDDHVVIEPGRAILTDLADQQGPSAQGRNDSANTAYALAGTTAASVYAAPVRFTDLTLDSPTDTDWFRFSVATATSAAGIAVTGLSAEDGLGWKLYLRKADAQGGSKQGALVKEVAGKQQAVATGLTLEVGDYLLQVSGNKVPTRYDLQFDLGNPGTATPVALGVAPSNEIRHDLILGGAGNDVLIGGPGEDYISGGDGNDVLSGGADMQKVDVMDGGAGDDTFQIWTDALALDLVTGVPQTPGYKGNDVFIGGAGNDRALLLGGDLDAQGRPIDDWATVRYSATNQRYELAAQVWDSANQRFVVNESDAAVPDQAATPQLHYAYFRLESTEQISVDLQAGQDTFRADPGYTLPDGTEWGLSQADLPAGAPVIDITASGGDGADLIVGGDGNDHISGGSGDDFLVGGGGDDHLDGGSGNDALYGGTTLDQPADRFEWVLRSGQLGANDAPSFATDVTDALNRSSTDPVTGAKLATLAATFHAGDGFDWYLVRVATSLRTLSATALTSQVAAGLSATSADVQVFMAEVGMAADGSITSVRTAANPAVKTYVLLRVANNPKVVSTTAASFVPFGSPAVATLVDGRLVSAVVGMSGSKFLGLAMVSPTTGAVTGVADFDQEVTLKTTGEPTQVQITALPSGGFVVTWTGPANVTDANGKRIAWSSLKLQRFTAQGERVLGTVAGSGGFGSTNLLELTGPEGGYPATHRTVALADDTVVLVWDNHEPATRWGVGGDRSGVQLIAFAAADNHQSAATSWVGSEQSNVFDTPDVTVGVNGTWAGVWSAAKITRDFTTLAITSTGRTEVTLSAASQVRVASYENNPYRAPQIQALPDGNLLVMWIGGSATDGGTEISTRVYDTNGRAVTATQRLALATNATGLDLLLLADGRVLGRWNGMARFIDAQGRGVGDAFALPADVWTADAAGNFALQRTAGAGASASAAIDQYSSVRDYSLALSSAVVDAASPLVASEPAANPIAQVLPPSAASAPVQEWLGSNTGLGLGSAASVADSGSTASIELAAPQSVGDFNGDGRDDLLVSDAFYSYLFLEPTVFGTSQDIASTAQVVIDRAVFGSPGVRMGDLDGDGLSDLVFSDGNQVNVLRGSAAPARKPVSADWSYTFGFNANVPAYGNLIVAVADYKDALPGADLVVLQPSRAGQTGTTSQQIGAIGSIRESSGWSQSVAIKQVPVAGDQQPYRLLVANLNGGDRQDLLIAHDYTISLLDGGNASNTVDLQNAYRRWNLLGKVGGSLSTPDLHLLGDINRDGLDDIALSFRKQVNFPKTTPYGGPLAAAVVLGSTNLTNGTLGFSTLVQDPAEDGVTVGLVERQVDSLYTVTAGDFDADGRVDLAVGRPFRSYGLGPYGSELTQDAAGAVAVFKSITTGASTRSFAAPNALLTGTGVGTYFGILPSTPAMDVDGDGYVDLLVTAPFAETFVGGVSSTGGMMRNYGDVVGRNAQMDLPDNPIRVANFQGKFLLGNDEGQPYVLSSQKLTAFEISGTVGYLASWYSFVLPGGGDDSNASLVLDQADRLTGSAGNWALSNVPLAASLYDSRGRAVSTTDRTLSVDSIDRAISLAGLAGGEYFLLVEPTSSTADYGNSPFSITFNLSNPNRDAPLRDRDELLGGDGVDRLVGGGQIDRLVGGAGIDIVRGESMEFIDRSGDVLIVPTARDPQAAGNSPTQLASAIVPLDANVAKQVRITLGLSASAPLRRSDMARLTDLDLSGKTVQSLAGLEAAINLETLKLNDLNTGGKTISLAPLEQLHRLRVLSARNASIASLPAMEGMTSLQVLDLANNQITSLAPLTGVTVVDDEPMATGSYRDSGSTPLLSGQQLPAVGGDFRFTDGNPGQASASWTLPNLAPGSYALEFSAPTPGNTPTLEVSRSGAVLPTSRGPITRTISAGVVWATAGKFEITGEPGAGAGLLVTMRANQGLVADAVRVVRQAPLPAALTGVDLSGNAGLSRAEVEVGGAALQALLTANAKGAGTTLLLPAVSTGPSQGKQVSRSLTEAQIFGTVFVDLNADGVKQSTEPAAERYWVGLDSNGDGRLDDELKRIGALTDFSGRFVITSTFNVSTLRLLVQKDGIGPLAPITTSFRPVPTRDIEALADSVLVNLGVSSWGLPAKVVAQEGTPLVLNAPTTLRVGTQTRSDLSYRWFVFANAADAVADTNRLAVVDGKQLSLNLLAPYARTIVAAAFQPGQSNPGLAQALTRTTVEVPMVLDRANTESTARVLAPVALTEADVVQSVPRVVDLRAALPYAALPNPAQDMTTFQTQVSISDASQPLPANRWDTATLVDGSAVPLNSPKLHTGAYVYEARLLDKASGQLLEQFRWTVTVVNQAPVMGPLPASLGRVPEGSSIALTPQATDPGGDTVSYSWQVKLNNAQVVASGQTQRVSFPMALPGTYTLFYSADDKLTEGNAGLTTTSVSTVDVFNRPPGGVDMVIAGNVQASPVQLTAVYLDGPDAHTFIWSVTDPANGVAVPPTETSLPTFSFTPTKVGNYAVSLTVRDAQGATGTKTRVLSVANALPTLTTNLTDRATVEGTLLSFTASGVDGVAGQGSGPVTYAWTAALGTTVVASANTADFSFKPPNQGAYAVTVRVTDQDGGAVSSSATVTVANQPPLVGAIARVDSAGTVLSAPASSLLQVAEGQTVFLKVAASDVPADTLTYDWVLLDAAGREMTTQRTGATWQLPALVNGAALQAGQYTVRVVVSDGIDAAPAVVRGLQFTNVASTLPVVPAGTQNRVLGDGALTGAFAVQSFGGTSDTLRAEIAWGDGDVDTITLLPTFPNNWRGAYSHAYTAKSTDPLGWQPTITVSDEESSISSSFRVLVTDGPKLTRTGGAALANLTEGVAGSWASYVLSLSGAPTADVRVDILGDDQLEFWDRVPTDPARVALSAVTFTAASFGPRTVYVTARNDDTVEASTVASVIRHRVVTTDARVRFQLDKAGGTPADLAVNTIDDDRPGIIVTPVGALQTTEAGGTAQFDIRLAKQPTDDVVIDLYSSNSAEGRLSSNAVRFTSQTWNIAQRITVTGVGDGGATVSNDTFEVRFAEISGDARYAELPAPAALTLTNLNVAPTLKVSNLVATTSGFTIEFNEAVDVGAINLYEATDPTERTGSPDITVARVISATSSVAVTGSLVFDASGKFATFVQRGGALTAGNYTVTVRGDRVESDGFASRGVRSAASGQSLDGDANGVAGGNYVGNFTVAAFSGATLSLADFARGPGQAVNVPAANAGLLPLTLNTGSSTTTLTVSAIDVVLKFDPTQLKINSVLRGAALPTDADLSFSVLADLGELRIVITRNTPFTLTGTALELLKIDAAVPASARYGADQVLDLSFKLNGGALATRADDAVHLAAYLGDVTGDGQYGALDVQRVSRVAGGLDTGFAPFARTSPLLIADITQSAASPRPDGFIGAVDKQALLDITLGGTRVEIPALPLADTSRPSLTLNSVSVAAGAQATLTMSMLQVPAAAQKVTVRIAFDDTALSFVRSRRGELALGFDDVNVTRGADGRAIVEISVLLRSQHAAAGVLGLLDFRALAPAAGRTLAVDVISLSVDDGKFPLGQTPVSGLDVADGKITVAAAVPLQASPLSPVLLRVQPADAAAVSVAGLSSIDLAPVAAASNLVIDWSGSTRSTAANLLLDGGKRRSWLAAALANPSGWVSATPPAKLADVGLSIKDVSKSSAARRAQWVSLLASTDKQGY